MLICAKGRRRARLPIPPDSPQCRTALIGEVFHLEWLTIGWMIVEAVVALVSGIAAAVSSWSRSDWIASRSRQITPRCYITAPGKFIFAILPA